MVKLRRVVLTTKLEMVIAYERGIVLHTRSGREGPSALSYRQCARLIRKTKVIDGTLFNLSGHSDLGRLHQ
jgi:hypothetical protein